MRAARRRWRRLFCDKALILAMIRKQGLQTHRRVGLFLSPRIRGDGALLGSGFVGRWAALAILGSCLDGLVNFRISES